MPVSACLETHKEEDQRKEMEDIRENKLTRDAIRSGEKK